MDFLYGLIDENSDKPYVCKGLHPLFSKYELFVNFQNLCHMAN